MDESNDQMEMPIESHESPEPTIADVVPGANTPEMQAKIDAAIATAKPVLATPPPRMKLFEYVVIGHPVSTEDAGDIIAGPEVLLAVDEGNARVQIMAKHKGARFLDDKDSEFEHLYKEIVQTVKADVAKVKNSLFDRANSSSAAKPDIAGFKPVAEIFIREF